MTTSSTYSVSLGSLTKHRQPNWVIALEYAQHNSLSRFLLDNYGSAIVFQDRKALVADITIGLSMVHKAGFVWGDCKPDNVLIYQDSGDPTSFKAKLSDFELSVSGSSQAVRFRAFSEPWTAPEARNAPGILASKQAEIYFLGLLMWANYLGRQQFYGKLWESDDDVETDFDGIVSTAQIIALSASGHLANIVLSSLNPSFVSAISEVDRQSARDILCKCLAFEPSDRPSGGHVYKMLHVTDTLPLVDRFQ
jgi:serine/threonine protein kinase